MSRAIKHLLIGGLIIMTTGLPAATTANENDRKLTIVNPQNLYDPTPNGYSTAVIVPSGARVAYISGQGGQDSTGGLRSEEHTSELQSLMRTSYAVFCLKKKTTNSKMTHTEIH